ncbi:glycoside hydrolase family 3 N-terminal domain-containing protein [Microbacterium sp.]|uniref:glycoside hydrolase family 3 N-terminal domain-containing protein n=1 Tax=Microbacterium sp. TaxID=51671 RepID=UPI003A8B8731
MWIRWLLAAAAMTTALAVASCAPAESVPSRSATASDAPRTPDIDPVEDPVEDPVGQLSLPERVGQLFMVGTPVDAASDVTIAAVTERHAGAVFLHGRTTAGTAAVSAVVGHFPAVGAAGVPLWVATDQEGGEVQVLRGRGFDDIPYAIEQADAPAAQVRSDAERWGRQLRSVGVTMNLAPVADIVTSAEVRFDNPPIGALGRQYGYDAETVAEKTGAFADGMRDAGVMPTFKHFPGLGRVTSNTDFADRVVDEAVGADAPDVAVYAALTSGGASVVMVSNAVHARIDDTQPATFSPAVIAVLRDGVGFDGVVMTDDVSAAGAVRAVAPADRALRALTAGVDLVLVSADPSVYAEMYDAVLARAQADPAFAARVDEAVRRVLAAKAAFG